MGWPLSQDYNEAIQSPADSFSDPELRQGEAVCNALGIPMPRSGNFADVYEVRCADGSRWAVKCFTREVAGLRDRYNEISRALRQAKLPFTVEFTYQEKGIRIRGGWYPVLKMEWVEGFTLNEFVREHLEKPAILGGLLQIWGRMGEKLREAGIAHADLQHGNVLLVPAGSASSLAVKLIDYDGMYVPSLAGKKSGEVGHPCYQHPQRLREGTYGPDVDRFPLLLIGASLRCLEACGRPLWERYDNGDNLLFRERDLKSPGEAAVFRQLKRLEDPGARMLLDHVSDALAGRLEDATLLDEVLPWLKPVVPALSPAAIQTTPAPRPTLPAAGPKGRGPSTPASASAVTASPARRPAAAAPAPDFDVIQEEEVSEGSGRRPRPGRRSRKRRKKGLGRVAWLAIGGVAAVALIAFAAGGVALVLNGHEPARADAGPIADNNDGKSGHQDLKDSSKPAEPPKKIADPPKDGGAGNPDKAGDPPKGGGADQPAQQDDPVGKVPRASVRLVSSQAMQHKDRPTSIGVSRDGKHAVEAGVSGPVEIWTLGNSLSCLAPGEPRLANGWVADVSPDGKHFLSTTFGDGAKITLWNLETTTEEATLTPADKYVIHRLMFSPDGGSCLVDTNKQGVSVWKLKTKKETRLQGSNKLGITAVRFLTDSRSILSVSDDGTFRVWNAETGELVRHFEIPPMVASSLAISPDGKRAALACREKRIHVLDLESGKESYPALETPIGASDVVISSGGLLVAAGNANGQHHMWVWDVATGQAQGNFEGGDYYGMCLAFAADGRTLVGGCPVDSHWNLRVWQVSAAAGQSPEEPAKGAAGTVTLRQTMTGKGHKGKIAGIAVAKNGRVVTTSTDGSVRVWALGDQMKEQHVFQVNQVFNNFGALFGVALTPDEKSAVIVDGVQLKMIDLEKGGTSAFGDKQGGLIRGLEFSADGSMLVTGCDDKSARVLNPKTGKEVGRFTADGMIMGVHLLGDGKQAVSTGQDNSLQVWDTSTGKEVLHMDGHGKGGINALAAAADGKRVVSAGGDGTVRGWDASTGREAYRLEAFSGYIYGVAVSPDGRLGVAATANQMRFWDMATGKEMAKLQGNEYGAENLTFSPDGKYLLASGANETTVVQVWEVSVEAPKP
jgi:WD40 repeat protein